MRIHPVISVFLAAWFGLGSTLGPRFLCLCADGTAAIKLGHSLCCDSDAAHRDPCGDGDDLAEESSAEVTVGLSRCTVGCESTILSDDITGSFGHKRTTAAYAPAVSGQALDTVDRTHHRMSSRGLNVAPHDPGWPHSDYYHIRSVILLV